jgi:LysM repeat protein
VIEPSQTDLRTLQNRSIPPPPPLPAAQSETTPSIVDNLCEEDSKTRSHCLYVVRPGETLSGIAQAFGLSSTPAFSAGELVAWSNGLHMAEATTIQPGQELRVPRATGVVHTVSSSEVLTNLAQQYGVSVETPAAMTRTMATIGTTSRITTHPSAVRTHRHQLMTSHPRRARRR